MLLPAQQEGTRKGRQPKGQPWRAAWALYCLRHGLGAHCFCLLPATPLSPHQDTWISSETQLQGASCWAAEDAWTMAVSGPPHQRKHESTPEATQAAQSLPCPRAAPL